MKALPLAMKEPRIREFPNVQKQGKKLDKAEEIANSVQEMPL